MVLTSFLLNRVPGERIEKILNTLSSTRRGVLMDPAEHRGSWRRFSRIARYRVHGTLVGERTPPTGNLETRRWRANTRIDARRSAVKKKKVERRSRLHLQSCSSPKVLLVELNRSQHVTRAPKSLSLSLSYLPDQERPRSLDIPVRCLLRSFDVGQPSGRSK